METINIQTSSKQYPVYIGKGIVSNLREIIEKLTKKPSRLAVITDETVASLYLNKIISLLENEYDVSHYVVPSGESAKSFQMFYDCHTFALQNGLDRSSLLIALGGGVVGDLAGFVAATYMRGIPFVQVPTTLLAHDSAVGGKVAINHPLGKNMIGAFHQPEAVVYDSQLLTSLPEKEVRSGFAEVIKHALIWDASFYHWLLEEIKSLEDLQDTKLEYAIKKGIEVKGAIVAKDEQEQGIRAFLNFGHTLGHAIEAELGYGQISHGEAVVIGMLYAIKVSEHVYQKDLNYQDLKKWFEQFGFPVEIPEGLTSENLLERMKKDKKSTNGKIRMVVLKDIGHVEIKQIEDELLLSLIK